MHIFEYAALVHYREHGLPAMTFVGYRPWDLDCTEGGVGIHSNI
jgi:hypothetical protein